ncbi:DUF5685 family protein [Rubritalea tangerina]|uniref:DUF5685 family protein n=1 Tax=Rubritalea tangerina TaxID=430798 RepID=A0ABW4ZCA7_9BACT
MFGFTQSPTACCQTRAHSVYKSHFCGLSCRLRRDYGHSARFLVNRDSTFLSLIGSSLSNSPQANESSTCCNPLANPTPLLIDSDIQAYSAAVAVCGLSAKCQDDQQDHRYSRAWLAKSVLRATTPWQDKALSTLNSLGFPTQSTLTHLGQQSERETPLSSFQQAASPTAHAYQNIFQHLGTILCPKPPSELATIGFSLGQLVYLQDAHADYFKDLKRDHYNPLRYHPHSAFAQTVEQSLSTFQQALAALPTLRHRDVLDAIQLQTSAFHEELLQPPLPSSKRKKRKKKDSSQSTTCCDTCDCCCCADLLECSSCSKSNDTSSICELGDCCDGCDCCGNCSCCDGCSCCN